MPTCKQKTNVSKLKLRKQKRETETLKKKETNKKNDLFLKKKLDKKKNEYFDSLGCSLINHLRLFDIKQLCSKPNLCSDGRYTKLLAFLLRLQRQSWRNDADDRFKRSIQFQSKYGSLFGYQPFKWICSGSFWSLF